MCMGFFFFIEQKTAYEMRIGDWSSDVCSSDLQARSDNAQKLVADMMAQLVVDRFEPVQVDEDQRGARAVVRGGIQLPFGLPPQKIGRASCRERVCQYV